MDEERDDALAEDEKLGLEPWEQRPTEEPRNYHVFEIFCNLGWQRSVRVAAEKFYAETGEEPPKSGAFYAFSRIATVWRWQERATCYWVAERRRAEHLLQARRDHLAERFMLLGEKTLGKYEKAFGSLEPHKNGKGYIEGLSKLKELLLGPDDEERKRRGRPSEQDGALPSVDDRLKPPEGRTDEQGRPDGQDQNE